MKYHVRPNNGLVIVTIGGTAHVISNEDAIGLATLLYNTAMMVVNERENKKELDEDGTSS